MNYTQIKKLALELGLEVENDLRWEEDEWTMFIDPKEGFSFQCQYHAASFVFADEDKKLSKSKVWEIVAEAMKYEAENLTPCDCGYWDEE
jgi:hypothetical protein